MSRLFGVLLVFIGSPPPFAVEPAKSVLYKAARAVFSEPQKTFPVIFSDLSTRRGENRAI